MSACLRASRLSIARRTTTQHSVTTKGTSLPPGCHCHLRRYSLLTQSTPSPNSSPLRYPHPSHLHIFTSFRDTTSHLLATEVTCNICLLPAHWLWHLLPRLSHDNQIHWQPTFNTVTTTTIPTSHCQQRRLIHLHRYQTTTSPPPPQYPRPLLTATLLTALPDSTATRHHASQAVCRRPAKGPQQRLPSWSSQHQIWRR